MNERKARLMAKRFLEDTKERDPNKLIGPQCLSVYLLQALDEIQSMRSRYGIPRTDSIVQDAINRTEEHL